MAVAAPATSGAMTTAAIVVPLRPRTASATVTSSRLAAKAKSTPVQRIGSLRGELLLNALTPRCLVQDRSIVEVFLCAGKALLTLARSFSRPNQKIAPKAGGSLQ